jgi:outer membrane lipase/esterase
VFAAFDGGKFDMSTTNLNPRTDNKNRSATVGVTMRVSEAVTVGLGVGTGNNEAKMSNGGFDIDDTSLSFFASAKSGGFHGNFTATSSDLKFKDIRRSIPLGQVTRVNRADTKGSNSSASIMIGYDFNFGPIAVGPFGGFTQQKVTVNGFTENAGAATALTSDLRILGQERTSRVSSFGLRASGKFGMFTPYARVSADTEENNQNRFVTASPVTVTQGILYDIPGYKGDKRWMTGTIGFRASLTQLIGLGVSYTAVSSKEGIKQDGVTANVNLTF